jgi:hypothetical protein
VGLDIPGDASESVAILSDRSLLDADLVIFQPEIPPLYGSTSYQGKRCLDDDDSFRLKEAIAHWRRELAAALEAGKKVILMLSAPEVIFVATGRKEYSGTGRNARSTRIVEPVSTFDMVPAPWQFHPATGTEMILQPDARILADYWRQFESHSEYRLYIDGDIKTPAFKTKSGNRVVGAIAQSGAGVLIALPAVSFDDDAYTEVRKEAGRGEVEYWSDEGVGAGNAFVSSLFHLADAFTAESARTPAPEWTRHDQYRMAQEMFLESSITDISDKLLALEEERRALKKRLIDAGSLRRLLYEQGPPLEEAILEALRLMQFRAVQFKEGDSEFDAVFESMEGRFIGEAEGKDSRPINVDKFSQLERNLNEDFARESVTSFAKGVLFGNAYRLRPVAERQPAFTEKCLSAAKRLRVALVSTPDMFEPARYILESADREYAAACRKAIMETEGQLVVFPAVPSVPIEASSKLGG